MLKLFHSGCLAVVLALAMQLYCGGMTTAAAQGFAGLFDVFSPLYTLPPLHSETRVTPIWTWLIDGKARVPSLGLSWDLRKDMGLSKSTLFLDTMVRIQVGRISLRFIYNVRDFKGSSDFFAVQDRPIGETRLDYSGWRFGSDVDLIQGNGLRLGANVDYDVFQPSFTATFVEADLVARGKKLTDASPMTVGFHVVLTSPVNLYGVAGTCEARARWPVLGAHVTEWELCGGLRLPESIWGTVALRTGYRRMSLEFKDRILYNGNPASAEFEVAVGGWFGEMVYYY